MSKGSDLSGKRQETVTMHALARLIEDVLATQGWNQAELGRRAGIPRSRITQLIKDPVKAVPGKATIIRLARGLGVPPWVVMDAVLEAAGLPTRPSYVTVEEAIAADTTLSASDKRAAVGFVEHLRNRPVLPRPAHDEGPDLAKVQGLRLAEESAELRPVNGPIEP